MDFDFTKLYKVFSIPANEYTVDRLQHGHINTTFIVTVAGRPVFILQKINTSVFTDVDKLMDNYRLVTIALSRFKWTKGFGLITPELIDTRDGKPFYSDSSKECWRLITYIDGADCTAVPHNIETAYQGGLAFGAFLKGVSEINPADLFQILPDFHSLERRYNEFLKARESAPSGRISLSESEIDFVKRKHTSLINISGYLDSGAIPLRVVHNDTKLSNVIFATDGTFRGVIDLDTVMAGSALFDFGDAIRSMANSACEDETDITKVKFEISLFEAFSKGYLISAGSLLHKTETDLLAESALFMTYIIGMRFLTDFLNGDIYFRTDYQTHNLVRAKNQFRMMEQMESEMAAMRAIIEKHRKLIGK
ncbi:MAG: aminoglycoside phosphotransferase family protein [Bacteroidales bacterium]|nr:aminoglycoside phosphotransferase family protein [Bacteroidales bacterium]